MKRVPESACTNCGFIHNAATSSELDPNAVPEPGDYTVCVNCAAVNRFGPNLELEYVDSAAIDSFEPETQDALRHAVRMVERMKRFKLSMPDGTEELDV